MKSASASGPIGTLVPSFIAVSTSSAEARPSCRAKHASLSIGMRIRLTMNPGMSFERTVVLPIFSASARVAA